MIKAVTTVTCALLSLATLSALGQSPSAGNASAEQGRQLYMKNMCYTCHGTVGQGGERGTGPQIAPTQWPYEAFAQQVRHPRQDMPRYPARFLNDQDLAQIYAYLKTIEAPRAVRDIDLLGKAP